MSTGSTSHAMRPPREITPRDFFESWLPAAYAVWREGRRPFGKLEVRARLEGEGGGAWDLMVGDDALSVSSPSLSETPVTLVISVEDWRALACGPEAGDGDSSFDLIPPRAGPLDILFIDPALRELVTRAQGTVRFEVTGYRGRTFSLLLKLGDQPLPSAPNSTITVDADTYRKLTQRALAPAEAYFSGKVRISGDAGLAMQLAMAMVARF